MASLIDSVVTVIISGNVRNEKISVIAFIHSILLLGNIFAISFVDKCSTTMLFVVKKKHLINKIQPTSTHRTPPFRNDDVKVEICFTSIHNITSIIWWNCEKPTSYNIWTMAYLLMQTAWRMRIKNLTENAINQINGHVHLASPLASESNLT